ncbi:MAG: glucosamine-6-phosphate deaminase [Lachnospiraceae bacterium]|nr:glucosamine-6-phosphate deaminase [Lachnospiraceae bacterium]
MRVYCGKDYEEASRIAANLIAAQVIMKPDCVLGLATGSTPIGTYQVLVEKYKSGELDFSKVHSINLDEYRGLSPENDQSYRYFMNDNLFNHVNIKPENTNVPDGLEKDAEAACKKYDAVIEQSGGIDLQLLGLGHNGHIGFNEPADAFAKSTNCVKLTQSTIDANARFFANADEVPKEAYTMGIGTIMQAKTVLVLVTGSGKRDIVKKCFLGDVTPQVPASILQFHPNFILVGDADALGDNFNAFL